jgi:hypothetical protein
VATQATNGSISFFARLLVIVPIALANGFGYLWLNHHLNAPSLLPLSPIDRAIPFMPWTIWPYLVFFSGDVVLPLALRRRDVFWTVILSYFVAILTNVIIWNLYPTTYPRPAPPMGDSITDASFRIMVGIDLPNVCFPSGHITIPAVGTWGLLREHPSWRVPAWALFAILSLTIVSTKQHYFVDIFGGLGTALWGIFVVTRLQRWRVSAEAQPS